MTASLLRKFTSWSDDSGGLHGCVVPESGDSSRWSIERVAGGGFLWLVADSVGNEVSPSGAFTTPAAAFSDMVETCGFTVKGMALGVAGECVDATSSDGWCYFALSREMSRVKIGKSLDVERRMREIRSCSPATIDVYGVVPNGVAYSVTLEKVIHLELDQHRLHGEWFKWNADVKSLLDKYIKHLGRP